MQEQIRIGIDLGGTKIAAIAMDLQNRTLAELRIPTPRHDYDATIMAIKGLTTSLRKKTGSRATIGIGIPGSVSPQSGLIQNANSTWLNGKPFQDDLQYALNAPVRMANDADCFALSEAVDGAGKGMSCVFGVIIGTGCGSGIVINRRILSGPHAISGEWGHTPLPWMREDEFPGQKCWCGRTGCLETWISGPAISAEHQRRTSERPSAEQIAARAIEGDAQAQKTLQLHLLRLARGLAMIVNIFDPSIIVLGGGLSKMKHLYDDLPEKMTPWIFADNPAPKIAAPHFGDSSGVRGAAWLWND